MGRVTTPVVPVVGSRPAMRLASRVGRPRAVSSAVRSAVLMLMVLPLRMAVFRSWAQVKVETPSAEHWFRNAWPLLVVPELAVPVVVAVPPTLTVLPLPAAMLPSWAQLATEIPELVHWLLNA